MRKWEWEERRTFLPATVTIVSPFVSVYVHAAVLHILSCVATLKATAPEASVTVVAVLLKPDILPTTVVVVASVVSPMPPTVDLLGAAATGAVLRTASAAELRPKTCDAERARRGAGE